MAILPACGLLALYGVSIMPDYICLRCGQLRLGGTKKSLHCHRYQMKIKLDHEGLPIQLDKCLAQMSEDQKKQEG